MSETQAMDWGSLLEMAKKDQEKFVTKGEKIVKRYKDERGEADSTQPAKRYNILWSNIRTLLPAVYAKKPQAQVERRYKDSDPIARTASQILERSLQYEIDTYGDYDSALRGCVLDRLLPGRGVAWIRYEQGPEITDDTPERNRKLDCTPIDYVFWKDFRHSPARTWEEVTWVARRVYMTEEEGKARFPDTWAGIPMTHEPVGMDDKDITTDMERMKKAIVWEIWDKTTETVVWKADGVSDPLDTKADFLKLKGFFPCPKPLLATVTTDSLIPVADYLEYQDQAMELDELTQRISLLVKAVKVVGVYDASQTGVQRMLQEGTENTLIGVDTWAVFSEKGGLKGVIDWLPIDIVIKALGELYIARESTKQAIYEITGLSDIIRGASVASETATAQQIKSNFASLRLKETQGDVARFATDLLQMKAEVMCEFYPPETLVTMSGIMLTEDRQYAEQAIQLLKSESMRNYRIEVATDSLVELDEQTEKQSRVEFLTAAGGFLEKAVQATQVTPELGPLVGEMLMFGVRAFKAGRPIEAAFEQAVQKLNQPQQPKPDPEAQKVQAQQQADAQKIQADQQMESQRLSMEQQAEANRLAMEERLDQQRIAMEDAARQREAIMQEQADLRAQAQDERMINMQMAFDKWKAELEAATKIESANIASKAKIENAATEASTAEIAREVT